MSEKRRKCATVLLRNQGKSAGVKVELYPAGQWPEAGAASGSYRVRQGGAWVRPGGGKYEFLGREAVGAYLASLLFGTDMEEAPEPLRRGTRVRATYRKVAWLPGDDMELGEEMDLGPNIVTTSIMTFTCSPVFQGVDGRWRVCVSGLDEPVLRGDVEVVE